MGVGARCTYLVVHSCTTYGDLLRASNIERIGVVAALGVTILIVNGNAIELGVSGTVYRENLDGGVLYRLCRMISINATSDFSFTFGTYEALHNRVGHGVSVEELGLLLSAVRALGVPPTSSVAIQSGTSSIYGERVARN